MEPSVTLWLEGPRVDVCMDLAPDEVLQLIERMTAAHAALGAQR